MLAILVIIIACVGGYLLRKASKSDSAMVFSMLLGLFAALYIIPSAYDSIAFERITNVEVIDSIDIVALGDSYGASGRFFLGYGTIDNSNYYTYVYETENGYRKGTLKDSKETPIFVKYTDDATAPHVRKYGVVQQVVAKFNIDARWFTIGAWFSSETYNAGDIVSTSVQDTLQWDDLEHSYNDFRYEICVPTGSITTDFTIDVN